MYELRCPNCGWSAIMSDEQVAAAVAEADRLKATHHIEHCPRCQWVIRMPVSSLREAAPVVLLAGPEAPSLLGEGKPATQARKAAAKKPAAKKAATRKSAAKKSAAKKPAAKKSAARKAPARKPAAKKSTARKSTTAKKPAARRKK